VIVLASATIALVNPCWAMITAYINERFHTEMRASGFGLGYSLAVVIPAFYAFYQDQLSHVMNPTYTVLPLLVIGGLLITLGGWLGPETRDVDLGGDVRDTEPATTTGRFTRDGAAEPAERATVAMSVEER
jgi:hypothetical protein